MSLVTKRLRRQLTASRFGLTVVVVVSLALFAWPVVALVLGAFYDNSPGLQAQWGIAAFTRAFGVPGFGQTLLDTLIFTAIVTPLAFAVGLALAIVSQLSNSWLARLLTPAIVLGYTMPPMFYAMGYALAGNGSGGWLNNLAQAVAGVTPFNLESWPGLIFVAVLRAGAFAYLLLVGPVKLLSRGQDDAARIAGAGVFSRLRTIVMPLLLPSVSGVIVLLIVSNVELFDTPYILGSSSNITTLAVLSYRLLSSNGTADYGAATAVGVIVLALSLLLVAIQQRSIKLGAFASVTGRPEPSIRLNLGLARWIIDPLMVLYVIVMLVIPVGSLVLASIQPFPGVYTHLSLSAYSGVLQDPDSTASLQTTVLLAVIGGLLAVAAGLLISYLRLNLRNRRVASLLTVAGMMPIVLSGVTGALAYIWAVVLIPPIRGVYGSFTLLLIAMTTTAVPTLLMLFTGSLAQIDASLADAARVSGASRWRAVLSVQAPLVLPSLVNGWYLSVILIAGTLDMPLILGSINDQPVAALVYNDYANAMFGETAALLCIVLAAYTVLRVLAQFLIWGLRSDLRPWSRQVAQNLAAVPDYELQPQVV